MVIILSVLAGVQFVFIVITLIIIAILCIIKCRNKEPKSNEAIQTPHQLPQHDQDLELHVVEPPPGFEENLHHLDGDILTETGNLKVATDRCITACTLA